MSSRLIMCMAAPSLNPDAQDIIMVHMYAQTQVQSQFPHYHNPMEQPTDRDLKGIKQELHQDIDIRSQRTVTQQRRYNDSIPLIMTDALGIVDSHRQSKDEKSYHDHESVRIDLTKLRQEDHKGVSNSTTVADKHGRNEVINFKCSTTTESDAAVSANDKKNTGIPDSTTGSESNRQKEFTNSTHAENNVKLNFTTTSDHQGVINSESSSITENYGQMKVTTSTNNNENVTADSTYIDKVTKNYFATNDGQKKVTNTTSGMVLDNYGRREATSNSDTIADNHEKEATSFDSDNHGRKKATSLDSSIIIDNEGRREDASSFGIIVDNYGLREGSSSDSGIIPGNHRRKEVTTSRSTTIANHQRGVTYSESTITDHKTVTPANLQTDQQSIADYRRRPITVPSKQTYGDGMTLPDGFEIPTQPDVPNGPNYNRDDERTKAYGPIRSTSAIKYPILPRLDRNNTEPCDVIAYFCLKAYKTGKVCGRAGNFIYRTFDTYCMMDYINCKERTNMWKIIYMGECIPKPNPMPLFEPAPIYEYHDDYFLDDTFVIDENFNEDLIDKEPPIHTPIRANGWP